MKITRQIAALSVPFLRELVEEWLAGEGNGLGYSATRLGREAIKDPNYFFRLHDGAEPRIATAEKILALIESKSHDYIVPRIRQKVLGVLNAK